VEAEWAPQLACTLWRREKYLPLPGIEPYSPVVESEAYNYTEGKDKVVPALDH
jgi:hypothetical protein